MWVYLYVAEKMRELEDERPNRIRLADLQRTRSHGIPVLGRPAAVAGRSMRRIGEALELWAHQRASASTCASRSREHEGLTQ